MDANKRTRIVSTIGIVIILAGLAFAGYRIFGRVESRVGEWLGPNRDAGTSFAGDERGATVDIASVGDLSGFSGISAEGGWKITITPGEYSVSVSASELDADDIEVSRRGDALLLSFASGFRTRTASPEARISVPDLSRIDIDGGAEVRLTGVDSPRLEIRVNGAASVTGIDARIEELHVDVDGAANVDFSSAEVVHASVEMDGASNLSLTMAGGSLTGVLRGVGNVTYGGEVSREAIRVEGLGRVRRR